MDQNSFLSTTVYGVLQVKDIPADLDGYYGNADIDQTAYVVLDGDLTTYGNVFARSINGFVADASNNITGYGDLALNNGGGNTYVGDASSNLVVAGSINGAKITRWGTADSSIQLGDGTANQVGDNNTVVGGNSFKVGTGSSNTSVGAEVLQKATSGSSNTAVGVNAGSATSYTINNCFFGVNSGLFMSTGTNCTFLGTGTRVASGSAFYNRSTAVGYNATLTASNQIVMGGGSEYVSVPSTTASTSTATGGIVVAGGVGIGENLHVEGTVVAPAITLAGADLATAIADKAPTASPVFTGTVTAASAPTTGNHLANKTYVDSVTGGVSGSITGSNNTFTGNNTFTNVVVASTAPTTTTHLTNKAYVDTKADAVITTLKAATNTFTAVNTFSNTTASTSSTTGAVVVTGGLGVGGQVSSTTGFVVNTKDSVHNWVNGVYQGTGDGVNYNVHNLKINSWHGIGFGVSIPGPEWAKESTKTFIDTRSGDVSTMGTLSVGRVTKTVAATPVYTSATTTATFTSDTLDNTTSSDSYSYAYGIYTASASNNPTSNKAFNAFNNNTNYWNGVTNPSGVYDAAGVYQGTESTTLNGSTAVAGEWLQIDIPYPLTPSSFTLTHASAFSSLIKTYTLAGSFNGAYWESVAAGTLGEAQTTTVSTAAVTARYSYFRLIIKSIYFRGNFTSGIRVRNLFITGTANTVFGDASIYDGSQLRVAGDGYIDGKVSVTNGLIVGGGATITGDLNIKAGTAKINWAGTNFKIESNYDEVAQDDRYGICLQTGGSMRVYAAAGYTPSSIKFCLATGADTYSDLMTIANNGDTKILSTTETTVASTGALVVDGGAYVAKHIRMPAVGAGIQLGDANKGICYSNQSSVTTGTDAQYYNISNGIAVFGWTDGCLGTRSTAGGGNKPILYWNYLGQVGINTNSPSAALDVVGDCEISSDLSVGGILSPKYTAPIETFGWKAVSANTSYSYPLSGGAYDFARPYTIRVFFSPTSTNSYPHYDITGNGLGFGFDYGYSVRWSSATNFVIRTGDNNVALVHNGTSYVAYTSGYYLVRLYA